MYSKYKDSNIIIDPSNNKGGKIKLFKFFKRIY